MTAILPSRLFRWVGVWYILKINKFRSLQIGVEVNSAVKEHSYTLSLVPYLSLEGASVLSVILTHGEWVSLSKKRTSSHFGLYRSKPALQTPLEKQQAARANSESRCQMLKKGYKAYQAQWHLPIPDSFQVDLRCNPMETSYQ